MPSVLVTGANRGLGLEFCRQYAAAGWQVFACCRHPADAHELNDLARQSSSGRVLIFALDVRDFDRIAVLAGELRDQPIDVLLNNAGIYGPNKMTLGQIDYSAWMEVLAVNTLAPLRMAECFVEHVARSQRKIIAAISSLMGSVSSNTGGRHYLYRSSKAALNAVVKSLAIDLRDRGIIAVTLHPGWVKTAMGGANAEMEIDVSVRDLIGVLDRLALKDSGRFLSHDGSEIPW
jgi:NAD(P)-dependent dehydrogenase (short-subunit alcohol dehydrogenase family)